MKYDLLNTDIQTARRHMSASDGARFRILLEIVKGCYGNCFGCSLSAAERQDLTPHLSPEQLRKTLAYFIPILQQRTHLTTSVVNLGVGDYFTLPAQALESIFYEIAQFFSALQTPRKLVTVSTSLFSNTQKIEEKIASIIKHLHPNQFAIDIVLDPFRMDKMYGRYAKNVEVIQKYFPFTDFVVNLSGNIEKSQVSSLIDFLKEQKVLNIDIQYAINNTNSYRVKLQRDKFDSFMEQLYNNFSQETMNLSIAQPTVEEHTSIFVDMQQQAREMLDERVFVNERGEIFPIAYALGDIILDGRFNFSPIGTIDEPFDGQQAQKKVESFLKKIFLKNKVCHTCEYNKKCYATGYAFYNLFTDNPLVCDNIGLQYVKS